MIQQRMHHIASNMQRISVSQGSFVIGWQRNDRDHFDLDVIPDNMAWTVTIEETGGQGTAWVRCVPSTGIGDKADPNIYINAAQENTTGGDRTADVRFSDDASEASDVVIEVLQEANPA